MAKMKKKAKRAKTTGQRGKASARGKTRGKKTAARGKTARGKSAKGKTRRKSAARELIAPRGNRRYVRREAGGEFAESDDAGRANAMDPRRRSKRSAPRGQGDRGDRGADG